MTVDRFTSRILGADGLRAIACLLVVWHHTSQKLDPSGTGPLVTALQFLGMRGEVGVSMFFVLSGCLLSLPFSVNVAGLIHTDLTSKKIIC